MFCNLKHILKNDNVIFFEMIQKGNIHNIGRVIEKNGCAMDFKWFPFDTQLCENFKLTSGTYIDGTDSCTAGLHWKDSCIARHARLSKTSFLTRRGLACFCL